MTTEVWVVLTSSNGWGKSDDSFAEAMDRALEHASRSYPPTEAVTYRITMPEGRPVDSEACYIDDFGTLHYPTGSIMKKVKWKVPAKLIKARTLFAEECEEVRYGREHSKAFD